MLNSSRRNWMLGTVGAAVGARSEAAVNKADDLAALTLRQASDLIRSKKASPVELTEACLARITLYNPKINAWITVLQERAIAQAKALENEQMAGKLRGPLHGLPLGLKDTIDTVGTRTT